MIYSIEQMDILNPLGSSSDRTNILVLTFKSVETPQSSLPSIYSLIALHDICSQHRINCPSVHTVTA